MSGVGVDVGRNPVGAALGDGPAEIVPAGAVAEADGGVATGVGALCVDEPLAEHPASTVSASTIPAVIGACTLAMRTWASSS
ncbi:hypothetical protein GCM10010442_55650 [Kitasatospora kifunensis]